MLGLAFKWIYEGGSLLALIHKLQVCFFELDGRRQASADFGAGVENSQKARAPYWPGLGDGPVVGAL